MKNKHIIGVLLGFVLSGISFASQQDSIVELCGQKLNAPESICNCIGEKAQAELTEDERSMLIAQLSEDQQTVDQLRSTMPVSSVMKAGMFTASAPADCAHDAASSP